MVSAWQVYHFIVLGVNISNPPPYRSLIIAETQYLLSSIVTAAAGEGTWCDMPLGLFYLIIEELIIYELTFY